MTQQPKRDATEDLEAIENELSAPWSKAARYGLGRAIYWIKEAEAQRERAEAAEQERDKLQRHLERIYDLCAEETTGAGSAVVMQYIDSIEEGSKPDATPEWESQVEMYLLTHPKRDPCQLRVINNVNLPNNPDFETLVEEWIVDNYGSLDDWEYHCLSHTEMTTIGFDTDDQKGD